MTLDDNLFQTNQTSSDDNNYNPGLEDALGDTNVDDAKKPPTKLTTTKKFTCSYADCNAAFTKNIRLQAHVRVNHAFIVSLKTCVLKLIIVFCSAF